MSYKNNPNNNIDATLRLGKWRNDIALITKHMANRSNSIHDDVHNQAMMSIKPRDADKIQGIVEILIDIEGFDDDDDEVIFTVVDKEGEEDDDNDSDEEDIDDVVLVSLTEWRGWTDNVVVETSLVDAKGGVFVRSFLSSVEEDEGASSTNTKGKWYALFQFKGSIWYTNG